MNFRFAILFALRISAAQRSIAGKFQRFSVSRVTSLIVAWILIDNWFFREKEAPEISSRYLSASYLTEARE